MSAITVWQPAARPWWPSCGTTAGWPAIAFAGSAETVISMSRRRSTAAQAGSMPAGAAAAGSAGHPARGGQLPPGRLAVRTGPAALRGAASSQVASSSRGQAATRPSVAGTEAAALAALAADPPHDPPPARRGDRRQRADRAAGPRPAGRNTAHPCRPACRRSA